MPILFGVAALRDLHVDRIELASAFGAAAPKPRLRSHVAAGQRFDVRGGVHLGFAFLGFDFTKAIGGVRDVESYVMPALPKHYARGARDRDVGLEVAGAVEERDAPHLAPTPGQLLTLCTRRSFDADLESVERGHTLSLGRHDMRGLAGKGVAHEVNHGLGKRLRKRLHDREQRSKRAHFVGSAQRVSA